MEFYFDYDLDDYASDVKPKEQPATAEKVEDVDFDFLPDIKDTTRSTGLIVNDPKSSSDICDTDNDDTDIKFPEMYSISEQKARKRFSFGSKKMLKRFSFGFLGTLTLTFIGVNVFNAFPLNTSDAGVHTVVPASENVENIEMSPEWLRAKLTSVESKIVNLENMSSYSNGVPYSSSQSALLDFYHIQESVIKNMLSSMK